MPRAVGNRLAHRAQGPWTHQTKAGSLVSPDNVLSAVAKRQEASRKPRLPDQASVSASPRVPSAAGQQAVRANHCTHIHAKIVGNPKVNRAKLLAAIVLRWIEWCVVGIGGMGSGVSKTRPQQPKNLKISTTLVHYCAKEPETFDQVGLCHLRLAPDQLGLHGQSRQRWRWRAETLAQLFAGAKLETGVPLMGSGSGGRVGRTAAG